MPANREFSEGETSSPLPIFKHQKPMITWSKAGIHIEGSLPRFMSEGRLPPHFLFSNIRSQ